MKDFPLTEEEWYDKRDNRTALSIKSSNYQKTRIGIKVDPQVTSSFSIQCMVLLSCNILARWCRNIVLDIPDCNTLLPNQDVSSFPKLIISMMSQIDPFGKFSINSVKENEVDQILEIGNIKDHNLQSVWIHGEGWVSGCGLTSSPIFDYKKCINPVGPSFAACLGSSILFQRSINKNSVEINETWHNLHTFSYSDTQPNNIDVKFPKILNLGNVHQIGCGAVGSSLDYLISLTNFEGNFTLIDHDDIDFSNCNRSLPFTSFHAIKPTKKVDICKNTLKSDTRQIELFPDLYSKFTSQKNFHTLKPDILLCLANENQIWATIQDNYPPLTFHATTTSNWGINFGRHIPLSEWCVLCNFSSNLKDNYVPKCETGVIHQTNNSTILGVLPFLSPAASVLLLAELIKLSNVNYPINVNFIEYSLQSPFYHNKYFRKPIKSCTCSKQFSGIYKKYRDSTKFWNLENYTVNTESHNIKFSSKTGEDEN